MKYLRRVLLGAGLVMATLVVDWPTARSTAWAAGDSRPPKVFTDSREGMPRVFHKISVADLPIPNTAELVDVGHHVIPRPAHAWPQAPADFKVQLFAEGLGNPRLIRTAPNGDVFVTEGEPGRILVYRGMGDDGRVASVHVFASGLALPFGIAFYPLGPNPKYVYIANTKSVVRFPYHNSDLIASGPKEVIVPVLPGFRRQSGGGHWSRNIVFSPDCKKMFISVGSRFNITNSDESPAPVHQADILEANPDGTGLQVLGWGIRNPVGLAINPETGDLWASVNEQLTFYEGKQFPSEYGDNIFVAEHGSSNRAWRTGYKVIRVPIKDGRATGEYADFLTGFVTPSGDVWGRPVGVGVAPDGTLLVTDDEGNCIWRVSYVGP